MFRSSGLALVVVALAGLAGCASSGGSSGSGTSRSGSVTNSFDEMTSTQIAAWAATSKYPQSPPVKKMDVTVIVYKDKNFIKVYNLSGVPIRNAKLWVNKTFVAKVDAVAPQTNLVINTDRLYDGVGNVFSKQTLEATTVQLEMDGGLYDLLGPVAE